MSDVRIDMKVFIERTPDVVFAAWSTAESLAGWFAPMAEQTPDVAMDFKVGGHYSIVMPLPDGSVHTTAGVFREIVPNEKIIMSWRCDAFADPESLVEVHFRKAGEGTELHLLHTDFDAETTCDAHRGGWEACLGQLVVFLTD